MRVGGLLEREVTHPKVHIGSLILTREYKSKGGALFFYPSSHALITEELQVRAGESVTSSQQYG